MLLHVYYLAGAKTFSGTVRGDNPHLGAVQDALIESWSHATIPAGCERPTKYDGVAVWAKLEGPISLRRIVPVKEDNGVWVPGLDPAGEPELTEAMRMAVTDALTWEHAQ